MRSLLFAVFVTVGFAAQAADALGRFGSFPFRNSFIPDKRVVVTNKAPPWSLVGRLRMPDGSTCTGSLVGPDLVLTAAHCVMKDGELMKGSYVFSPGYSNGTALASSGVKHVWWGSNQPNTYRSLDWAILRLVTPLGNQLGWFGTKTLDLSTYFWTKIFSLSGYSGDTQSGHVATAEVGCAITDYVSVADYYLHNCSMSRGASGGPMFYSETVGGVQKHWIIALNVAERRGGGETSLSNVPYSDTVANVAISATKFMATLINLRSQ